jgi:hypothetical protein
MPGRRAHNAVLAAIVIFLISASPWGLGCRVNPIFCDRLGDLDSFDVSALGDVERAAIAMVPRSTSKKARGAARELLRPNPLVPSAVNAAPM